MGMPGYGIPYSYRIRLVGRIRGAELTDARWARQRMRMVCFISRPRWVRMKLASAWSMAA
jgi:hypothetical protein